MIIFDRATFSKYEKREAWRREVFIFAPAGQNSLFQIQIICFPRADFPNHLGKLARIWKRVAVVHLLTERNSARRQGFGKYVFQIKVKIKK